METDIALNPYGAKPKCSGLGGYVAPARIGRGESVTAPRVASNYPDQKKLATEDCIKPPQG